MSIPFQPGEPLTCQQIRELDVLAIEHVGVPGIVLMENAARSVAEFVYAGLYSPGAGTVVILCGPGNNGGDGLVIARHLHNAGVPVVVALAVSPAAVNGDAAINLGIYRRMEQPLIDASTLAGLEEVRKRLQSAEVVVDALLGTGSKGPPRGAIGELVSHANAAPRARRIAVDIPTGLDADTGKVADPCFRADATVTFVAEKTGFHASAARSVLGRVVVADVGVPRALIPGR